ncbi:exodeoxyribonuclease VII small subunit [Chromohalobacter marismortui]|uniref:Exodeoxyribonuclease 7 small subunit n=1 Tax=Chromohalobacter marismortui TaxID=42055 RepID=A0A4R7NNA3_9GAMM|nr:MULTISPECIES: exodeoxyribonuclease VII small subunit [Chromohalobacter]MCI0509870.1 exodeoxyribonuclease VII small subunit [Chromohalobacter sp.]MCI0591876.1 exodeoxyribonuclease VII small subunit [Chromohalobacter sp.]TDU22092.1 exodeoxyribonuclease VII small subunit [Chromohalobacter marismortui]
MVEKDASVGDVAQSDETDGQDAAPEDFAATLARLESLVAQLESGELSLEASLVAFERGVHLTRDAQQRLENAELRVKALLEQPDGSFHEVPFDAGEADGER